MKNNKKDNNKKDNKISSFFLLSIYLFLSMHIKRSPTNNILNIINDSINEHIRSFS